MKAICPGSFDPVTHGHLDIVARSARLFDEAIVSVGRNSAKNYLFTPDERVSMLRDAVGGLPGVTVTLLDGLLVDFCRAHDVDVIVKVLRFASDFDFELQMAETNHALTGIETIMLPTSAQWSHLTLDDDPRDCPETRRGCQPVRDPSGCTAYRGQDVRALSRPR